MKRTSTSVLITIPVAVAVAFEVYRGFERAHRSLPVHATTSDDFLTLTDKIVIHSASFWAVPLFALAFVLYRRTRSRGALFLMLSTVPLMVSGLLRELPDAKLTVYTLEFMQRWRVDEVLLNIAPLMAIVGFVVVLREEKPNQSPQPTQASGPRG